MRHKRILAACFVSIVFHLGLWQTWAIDLGAKYPATLDYSETTIAYQWTSGEKDVWRLSGFKYSVGERFKVEVGPSQVVFGCTGTNVLWAALVPDKPGEIVIAEQGQGEHITSIWFRFNPARVGDLFPTSSVTGQGDASMVLQGKRLDTLKMVCGWQAGNKPVIPWKRSIVIDVETSEGVRRYYSIDTDAGTVKYVDAFRNRTLPPLDPIEQGDALEAFDKVWEAFDKEYAMFSIKPNVDWSKLRDTYRPRAEKVKNSYELGAVLADMLAHLEDLHVYVMVKKEYVPGYNRHRSLNANWKAASNIIGRITNTRKDLAWAISSESIGYINIYSLSNQRLPQLFEKTLEKMSDTKGLIIDLRFNGGGSETLGIKIAGSFLDKRRVYSTNQYRNGPRHSDLGQLLQRSCKPSGPWYYTGPVVVLQGQKTMSSAESFALMLAQCPQVITMGDRTAGSSANPRRIKTNVGITVNLPRWLDMDPDGKPIDAVGVAPDIPVKTTSSDFSATKDKVLLAALRNLEQRRVDNTTVLKRREGASAGGSSKRPRTGKEGWSPMQATGSPNSRGSGDMRTAWASQTQDDQDEWLLLAYEKAVAPERIEIHETFNPGAVYRVSVFTAEGKEIEAWKGADPTPISAKRGVSKIPLNVDFKTQFVKIYLLSSKVRGWNEIDAVELIGKSSLRQWAIKAEASSTFADIAGR
jgi:Peptidase family S41/Tricorn protease C1 domain